MRRSVIEWLLDSDPSIRWQVMRDLIAEPDAIVVHERSRVAAEGWGARLLDLQGSDGHWGGAAFVYRTPSRDNSHTADNFRLVHPQSKRQTPVVTEASTKGMVIIEGSSPGW